MKASDRGAQSYEDILHCKRPVSKNHPQMSVEKRAAQFAPFAALTGYEACVNEEARLTSRQILLDEDMKASLNDKLHRILEDKEETVITYFQPDGKKEGGEYITVSGKIKKIDTSQRILHLEDGLCLPMDAVVELNVAVNRDR